MVKECRWMKQEVCSGGGESPRGYLPPPRQAGRTGRRSKKDPIQQLLEPLSNIVRSILEPIGKLLNHKPHSERQPRCKWVPKEWCEERPKEWCEPMTKQKCNQVASTKCVPTVRDECSLVTRRECKPTSRNDCKIVPMNACTKKLVPKCENLVKSICKDVPSMKCETIVEVIDLRQSTPRCFLEDVEKCSTIEDCE